MAFVPIYILILFFTIAIDYLAGIYIEKSAGIKKKQFLILSILANVGVLCFFKYYNFLISNTYDVLNYFQIHTNNIPYLNIILPIGLSFHTFQAMSYTIEVYRGNQKAEKHIGIYSLYVMFYPQLVAGPIERPQNLLHQFREKHIFNQQNLLDGLRLMLWGFFKKIVIADRVAIYVNTVFDHPANYHYINLIIASIFFAIQIYCDFSGYSDIAIGSAKTMGFDLMTNFNRPYFSKNIQEFWRRWHISLSTWFKDYVYISLGGNRKGVFRMYLNLIVVFLLSGFWHGANWTFVAWGAIHALLIVINLIIKNRLKFKFFGNKLFVFANVLTTNIFVFIAWIFFRSNTISDSLIFIKRILIGFNEIEFQLVLKDVKGAIQFSKFGITISVFMIVLMFILEKVLPPNLSVLNKRPFLDVFFMTLILCLIILLGVYNQNSFIYFQF